MTKEDLKAARHKLGLSCNELAHALGVSDGRTVRRWEAGEREIPGPVIRLIAIWLDPLTKELAVELSFADADCSSNSFRRTDLLAKARAIGLIE